MGFGLRPGVRVELSDADFLDAGSWGARRRLVNILSGREGDDNNRKDPEKQWQHWIDGAIAEKVVQTYLLSQGINLKWPKDPESITSGDIGPYEVRHSRSHANRLIVKEPHLDNYNVPYIFVTGTGTCQVIRGWIFGHDAMKPDYWWTPETRDGWSFFCPQDALQDISTLPPVGKCPQPQKLPAPDNQPYKRGPKPRLPHWWVSS